METLHKKVNKALVVVDGNRRVAALHYLRDAIKGNPPSRQWFDMLEGTVVPTNRLFSHIPYLIAGGSSRRPVRSSVLENVAGIKTVGY